MATLFPLRRFATPGKQCALIASGDYRPSLRYPWPAAVAGATECAIDRDHVPLAHECWDFDRRQQGLIRVSADVLDAVILDTKSHLSD
jgi:hypothetical protein